MRCDKSDSHNWKHPIGAGTVEYLYWACWPRATILSAEGWPGDLRVLKIAPKCVHNTRLFLGNSSRSNVVTEGRTATTPAAQGAGALSCHAP